LEVIDVDACVFPPELGTEDRVTGGEAVVRVDVAVVLRVPVELRVVVGLPGDVVVVTGGPGLFARTELGENGGCTFGLLAPNVHASTLPGGGS
jgi:hypothetical protein